MGDFSQASKVKYFVSFSHSNGFGNIDIYMPYEIESYDDIIDAHKAIGRKNPELRSIVILFYRLMGKEQG